MSFISNCVNWPRGDVEQLSAMIERGILIERATFLQHVDRAALAEIESQLGYEAHPRRGLTMAGDYHVSYNRSKLHGRTVYYFTHSAIEYVFEDCPQRASGRPTRNERILEHGYAAYAAEEGHYDEP